MAYDVAKVRSLYPALASGEVFLDNPGGTQVPQPVIDAVSSALGGPLSNRSPHSRPQRAAGEVVVACREALADLLAADPRGIVFGRSMTALTYDLARTLAGSWSPGEEVVVTRLDHDANIRPWVQAAERVGAVVRWADFDTETMELRPEHLEAVLGDRTRLVALPGASNVLGTRPDVRALADLAHEAGALVFVDGVHHAAHEVPDLAGLGADLYACSPYKFGGPHCGVLAADPDLLEELHPDKLVPSTDEVPERFELGTLPYELMAGTTAAVDVLASLGESDGPRRDRLVSAYDAIEQHEDGLRRRIEDWLLGRPGVTVWSRAPRRTSTLYFSIAGVEPAEVHAALGERQVSISSGHCYAWEPCQRLGLGATGALRVGLAPYNDAEDVDRLLAALDGVLPR
ncbi:cysteine desulfurase-like protein [Nocardioides coralli]|uniref:cysteine desulfurase-like protein n=1 Tax=Nocardioides coralli TaxID=2872154 RepID=UPI001CA4238E|nr:cysteine desulfurase-like protein [Nocardioides coralli]QZY27698.1 cysteine desulfurase-like protein [Nocardioides coralli]